MRLTTELAVNVLKFPVVLTSLKVLRRIIQHYYPSLVAIGGLVNHIELETGKLRRRLFEHFAEILYSHFEVLLVVFKDFRFIIALKIESERISPLQCLSALLQGL